MTSEQVGGGQTSRPLTVSLPASAYSIEAVHRATYALMAKLDVRVSAADSDIVCVISSTVDDQDQAEIERTFMREVVDQELRLAIESRTETYRDLILGLAFSRTGLQDG